MGCASGAPGLYTIKIFLELYSLLEQGCCNLSSLWGKAEMAKKRAKAVDIRPLETIVGRVPRVLKGRGAFWLGPRGVGIIVPF